MSSDPTIVRVPPNDEAAEIALIGSVLVAGSLNEPADETIDRVEPDAFWNKRHAQLWSMIRDFRARSIPIDAVLLQREVEQRGITEEVGGRDAVATAMAAVPSHAHATHYADLVLQLHQRRTLMFACEEVARGLTNGLDVHHALSRLSHTISTTAAPAASAGFQTAETILSSQEPDMLWLIDCLLPANSLVALCGEPKVGKTVMLSRLLSALLTGRTFVGLETRQIPAAVWLSEESPTTLRTPLLASGLTGSNVHLLTRGEMRRLPWQASAQAAIDKCAETGAKLLIVDTFAAWAGLSGEEENQVGPVQDALRPLQTATTKGVSVLLTHHLSKDPGRQGVGSIRGSSAFAGAVDGFLLLRREGPQDSSLRSLYGAGRGDGWANGIRYELDPDGSLRRINSKGASITAAIGPEILRTIAANPGASTSFLYRSVGGKKTDFLLALDGLENDGKITFDGGSEGTAKKWRVV